MPGSVSVAVGKTTQDLEAAGTRSDSAVFVIIVRNLRKVGEASLALERHVQFLARLQTFGCAVQYFLVPRPHIQ